MDFFIIGIILAIIFIVLINYVFFYDRKKFRYRQNIPTAVPSKKPDQFVPAPTGPSNEGYDFIYVGLFRRLAAFIIDIIMIYFILLLSTIILGIEFFSNIDSNILASYLTITYYPLFILYFALFDAGLGKLNASPGKKLLSIIVIDSQFQRVSFWRSFARSFLKVVPFMLIFGLIIPFSRNHQALWDMIVKTNVVFDPNKEWINNLKS